MKLLESLINPLNNCEETAYLLCKALDVPITKTTLVTSLLEHPDYPSLLSISDVLQNYRVKNMSIRVKEQEKLIELPTPFIAQTIGENTHSPLFTLIYRINSNKVEWHNPESHKVEIISLGKFITLFTNYVQLYEVGEDAGEKEYSIILKKEKRTCMINNVQVFTIPILTLMLSLVAFLRIGIDALFPVLYACITLAGAIAGALLILYEIDQYNPTLQKVCVHGGKTNCAAILHSKGSKIFGFHWSGIGFSYFMGVLAVLLAGGLINSQLLSVAAWINVIALPYTVYSIYYQARIVKQWCPMCLSVQLVLVLLFVTSLAGGFFSVVSLSTIFPYLISMSTVFLAVYILLPAFEKSKDSKLYLHSLQRLKHNPQIFEALLAKQKHITEPTEGLGITIGNPYGKIHMIKVCNPYCRPCAKAHPIIDKLLASNPDIRLQIIFTATEADEDYRNKPVKALLALQQNSAISIEDALDNWYLAKEKKYDDFLKLYPLAQDKLNEQIPAIIAMREWCDKTNIEFTPTFFINSHLLPEIYSVEDIRYFLSV